MATPTDALYKALIDTDPNPQVVHNAIEQIRQLSGQNVIEILGAKIDAQGTEIKADIKALNLRIDAQGTEIKALGSRIDTQQKVFWPLIGLLATTVFGLLFKLIVS